MAALTAPVIMNLCVLLGGLMTASTAPVFLRWILYTSEIIVSSLRYWYVFNFLIYCQPISGIRIDRRWYRSTGSDGRN